MCSVWFSWWIKSSTLVSSDHRTFLHLTMGPSRTLVEILWVSAWTDEEHGQQLVNAESPISPEACNSFTGVLVVSVTVFFMDCYSACGDGLFLVDLHTPHIPSISWTRTPGDIQVLGNHFVFIHWRVLFNIIFSEMPAVIFCLHKKYWSVMQTFQKQAFLFFIALSHIHCPQDIILKGSEYLSNHLFLFNWHYFVDGCHWRRFPWLSSNHCSHHAALSSWHWQFVNQYL